VLTCRADESVQSLMNTMREQRIRHLPVVDDTGRLSGLVSIGDVVKSHVFQIEQLLVPAREPHDVPRSQAANSGVIVTAFH
jgi:CBS-domain-containing membrane protein